MGTESIGRIRNYGLIQGGRVKLNNPLMGTERTTNL